MPRPKANPAEVLRQTRRDALKLAGQTGAKRLRVVMKEAQRDLDRRLQRATGLKGPGTDSFTAEQLRLTLAQVKDVLKVVDSGMVKLAVAQGRTAADKETAQLLDYIARAERKYAGMGARLPLKEAAFHDRVVQRTEASVLRRLSGKEKDAWPTRTAAEAKRKKQGIMDRYGSRVVANFEKQLMLGVATRKPWAEVRADLVDASPFLKQAPMSWAERIIRTETMAASNRAGWESVRAADDALGDMVKILSASFDDRTSWDSYQVHGQIRRPDEAFEGYYGAYQHPPARPNDREVVVPHRISWPIPADLEPVSDDEVVSRFYEQWPNGPGPGPRPEMSTVDREKFGKETPKR